MVVDAGADPGRRDLGQEVQVAAGLHAREHHREDGGVHVGHRDIPPLDQVRAGQEDQGEGDRDQGLPDAEQDPRQVPVPDRVLQGLLQLLLVLGADGGLQLAAPDCAQVRDGCED